MRVHRSAHKDHFTVLPNEMLQRVKLRNGPRGLLAFLLSLPDGWRMTAQQMAAITGDSLWATRKALRDLTRAGYYTVVKTRLANGRIISVQHVTDTPAQFAPGDGPPVPGPPAPSKTKEQSKETSLPPRLPEPPVIPRPDTRPEPQPQPQPQPQAQAQPQAQPQPQPQPQPRTAPRPPAPVPALDDRTGPAAALLLRVVRPEPRLRIGEAEAARLAPLVAHWIDLGSTPADLAAALLPGLPEHVHFPAGFIHRRLIDKRPALPAPRAPLPTCPSCHDPVPRPGPCPPCGRAPDTPPAPLTGSARAFAREAVRAAQQARSRILTPAAR
ncbi:hypothetical protein [Kitasatospora cineracea]|uniref:Helix-turn-helix protein n=1 Tax=Kitasatospora cineracea TaxID=88074 RepID=A0A3N4SCE2_9ACTN|nr:hypothetical protein [Kitasatospora cineracea]RPE34104.1 hypothetical protein EDD38_2414 [Kitasatospora cineracea]